MSKRQTLYYKQFLISTGIVGIVIFILMLYFFISLRQNYFESRTSEAEKVCAEVSNIIQENKNTADYLYRDLYRSRQELDDLIAYFTLEPEEYWEFRLDLYSKSNLNKYRSMETFLDSAFEASQSLKKIELISYYKMDNTVAYKNEIFHYMNGKDRLTEIENHTEKTSDIIFIKEVRHPDTFKLEGCIILTFENSNQFENLINSKSYAELIVTKDFIQPIYNENALERWYNVIQSSKTGEQENIFSYTILNKNIDAYQNIFKYEIICPESLMNKKIIKFILQPIIENYFIHGIRSTKQDNIIKVYVNQNKNSIDFHIIDNGRGMSEDAIKNKNEELQNTLNIEHNNKSIGVSNVNRRIKAIYGEKYGVKLRENNEKMGLEVIVKIKEEV